MFCTLCQRGPRYFDPPDSNWGTCYNCGGEGHLAVNCTSLKRKRPCFVCGSLEHGAKQCKKVRGWSLSDISTVLTWFTIIMCKFIVKLLLKNTRIGFFLWVDYAVNWACEI